MPEEETASNICDYCKDELDPGQTALVLLITEMTADGYPYLPQAEDEENFPDDKEYKYCLFCSDDCAFRYLMEHIATQLYERKKKAEDEKIAKAAKAARAKAKAKAKDKAPKNRKGKDNQ